MSGSLCPPFYLVVYAHVFSNIFFLLFSRFDTLARSELSQVRGTSFSGGEGIALLPAISCKFCNPNGSCIEQSGLEPSPATASRQPAHRPVTQDAGSAPHDDKRPTRFVGRSLKYPLYLASEATDKQKVRMVQASSSAPPHRCSQIRSSAGKGRSRNHQQPANLRRTRRRPIAVFPILCSHPSGLVTFRGP